MPKLASAVSPAAPRIKIVYSREDFTKIPVPDRVAEYPELRYMGSKHRLLPWILIESKGYGTTGSKMTDILGDIRTIIAAKRSGTAFLFFTDGLTWKQRKSDLRKIVEFQNNGDITRIYNFFMADQFEADLRQLEREFGL
jgi:DpnII restriction endonuclease